MLPDFFVPTKSNSLDLCIHHHSTMKGTARSATMTMMLCLLAATMTPTSAFVIQVTSICSRAMVASSLQASRAPRKKPSGRQINNDKDDPYFDFDSGGRGDASYSSHESSSRHTDSGDPFDDFDGYDQHIRQSREDRETPQVAKTHFFSQKLIHDPTFIQNTKIFDLLCQGMKIDRPSKIQALAWPVILEGNHAIVADQTGSGKTLAYLIPLLQRALSAVAKDSARRNGSPRLLVLAPTAELADQIKQVCNRLSKDLSFSSMVITSTGMHSTSIRDQIRLLQRQPVDVMISTPGRIATILRTRNSGLDLTQLQSIVLDEVDVLMVDETFGPQLRTVGAASPVGTTQFVFVTATLPDSVIQRVEQEFPGVVLIKGPGLHRVALTVKEHLVDVSVPSSYNRDIKMCFDIKAKQLLKCLRQNRCRRTLIFCNTVESCRTVENLLNRKDRRGQIVDVGAYHNAMTPDSRNAALRKFAHGEDDVDYILVCTDRAARGVDFDAAPVDHVVLWDFPKDPAEYVRRVGRTARAGRDGVSTVFCYGWQLPIARKIMGSKLESFTVAVDDMKDGDDEIKGGVQGRRQLEREKHAMIGKNIQGGKLWKEKVALQDPKPGEN